MTTRFGLLPLLLVSLVMGMAGSLCALTACAQNAPPVAAPAPAPIVPLKDVAPVGTYTNPVLDADRTLM